MRNRIPQASAQARIGKICTDLSKKRGVITADHVRAVLKKHKFPVSAYGVLSNAGYVKTTTTTRIALTRKGADAARGKFKRRRR